MKNELVVAKKILTSMVRVRTEVKIEVRSIYVISRCTLTDTLSHGIGLIATDAARENVTVG